MALAAAPNDPRWKQKLLAQIHAPVTSENIRFIDAWQPAEGGSATNNPFNTTQPASGATNYNSVGVKNYATPEQGIAATAQTLQNGRYGPLITALRGGTDARAAADALAASPWGTGSLVQRMLGSQPHTATIVGNPPTATATPFPPAVGSQSAALAPSLQQQPVDARRQFAQALLGSLGPNGQISNLSGLTAALQQRHTALAAPPPPALAQTLAAPRTPQSAAPSAPAPAAPAPVTPSAPGSAPPAVDVSKWAIVAPGADREGASTSPAVVSFVAQIAEHAGHPLTITTGTNHNQYVVNTHRESAHWTGNAADIAGFNGSGPDNIDPNLTRLGQEALITAGADPAWAAKQTGGLFNVNGRQIIFNSFEGGNHYNHLHVGLSGGR